MRLQKLISALGMLVSICVVPTIFYGQSVVQTGNEDVVGRAKGAYYDLTKHGFTGFKANIDPNWNVILAHTATPDNLKVFRAVQFAAVGDVSGRVIIQYEIDASEKRRLESTIRQIHRNMQGLVGGFFNTWRMFTVASPFGPTENEIKVEERSNGYRFSYSTQPADVVLTTTKDFVITEWRLTSPTAIRTVRPQFRKTPEGLLLTGYDGDFQPVGPGITTNLTFSIEYQNVKGMHLPHIVRIKGMHGTEAVAAELTFNQYVLGPSPPNQTPP